MINQWLLTLSNIIENNLWLAPVLAIVAGVLTAFTPCSLSTIPLVVAYVGGTSDNDARKSFRLSAVFALGMAVTFTVLGVIASLAGKLIGRAASWWYIVLGVLMVLMALQTWEVFNFIPSTFLISKNKKRGYIGSLLGDEMICYTKTGEKISVYKKFVEIYGQKFVDTHFAHLAPRLVYPIVKMIPDIGRITLLDETHAIVQNLTATGLVEKQMTYTITDGKIRLATDLVEVNW